MHYFGSWDDPQAALDKYLAEKDFWYAGTLLPTEIRTVAEPLNEYLGKKQTLGPAALKRRLTIARSVFKAGGISANDELKPPPAKVLRQAKLDSGER